VTAFPTTDPLPRAVAERYPYGYAVVDVETSGLRPQSDRLLQVAVTQVAPDGAIEAEWSTLLDPGCDPGPVHVHGLTRERLAGSPQYEAVSRHVAGLTAGRVLVAHNARFDWAFLSAESDRARARLDIDRRLCTMAVTRRLDLPVSDLKLSSVAAYWGVRQVRPHDAVDDTRVVVEILRHSLALAHRLDAHLPLASCSEAPRAHPPAAPRPVCPWRYPGKWHRGAPLRQGMKIAFTGDTSAPREALITSAAASGLDVMNNVSSRTSLLVCNSLFSGTTKATKAQQHDTPTVTESEFATLLPGIAPGHAKTDAVRPPAGRVRPTKNREPGGRLAGHRVLVLGGDHDERAVLRERISTLGGQGAANLTASVTHAILLAGYEQDPRALRVMELTVPRLDQTTLESLTECMEGQATNAPALTSSVVVLPRGGVTDLAEGPDQWELGVTWQEPTANDHAIDVVAFVTDEDEQVGGDEDFCFYNHPVHAEGSVEMDLDAAAEANVTLTPGRLSPARSRVVVSAAIDGDRTFGDIGPIELTLRDAEGQVHVRATLDAATAERTLELAHLYQRNGVWRFRAVGQGYEEGLAHLAVLHGVDVED